MQSTATLASTITAHEASFEKATRELEQQVRGRVLVWRVESVASDSFFSGFTLKTPSSICDNQTQTRGYRKMWACLIRYCCCGFDTELYLWFISLSPEEKELYRLFISLAPEEKGLSRLLIRWLWRRGVNYLSVLDVGVLSIAYLNSFLQKTSPRLPYCSFTKDDLTPTTAASILDGAQANWG